MRMSRRESLAALIATASFLGARTGRGDEPEIVVGAPNSLTGGLGLASLFPILRTRCKDSR